MLRTRSWVADGSRPAAVTPATNSSGSGSASPRTCRLPREVSCSRPLPYAVARAPSRPSAAPLVWPPGMRTRTMAPSAARCGPQYARAAVGSHARHRKLPSVL